MHIYSDFGKNDKIITYFEGRLLETKNENIFSSTIQ
jgi:hypothetical protein